MVIETGEEGHREGEIGLGSKGMGKNREGKRLK